MDDQKNEEVAKPPLRRYAVCVEYDGSQYHGWQSQPGDVSCVQESVERALGRIANHPVSIICAGRTDSGVHASYQIIHFDSSADRPERGWLLGSNTYLPDDVCIKWIKPVSEEFHARFSATERRYRYVIFNGPVKPALLSRQLTWTYRPLDEARMQEAANYLVGSHDFSSYRAVGCQAHSPVRDVRHLWVKRFGQLVVIDVRANAFLHHMIRNIAGVLMKIGSGDAEPVWAKEVLESRDRRKGGVTAPPFGLYFVNALYPDEFNLPKSELGPVFLPQFD